MAVGSGVSVGNGDSVGDGIGVWVAVGDGASVKALVGFGVAVGDGDFLGISVAVGSGVGVNEGVAVGVGENGVGVRVGDGDGGALVGDASGVTDGAGVTVATSLDNSRADGTCVAVEMGVAEAVEVGLTAASIGWTAGVCSGGATAGAGLQPTAIKKAAIARTKAGSGPRY